MFRRRARRSLRTACRPSASALTLSWSKSLAAGDAARWCRRPRPSPGLVIWPSLWILSKKVCQAAMSWSPQPLALRHVAAEDVESAASIEVVPSSGPRLLGERRELLEHRFHGRARVVVAEFEAHRPAAQIFVEEGLLVRILEVGGAHHEGVGKQRRASARRASIRSRGPWRSTRRAALPRRARHRPGRPCSAVPQVGQPASTYFTLVMSTPCTASIGSTIDCQAAEPSRMVLPSSFLRSLMPSPLRKARLNVSSAPHVEHRLELHAVLEGEREDARRRKAHVGLADIDELHASRCRPTGRAACRSRRRARRNSPASCRSSSGSRRALRACRAARSR